MERRDCTAKGVLANIATAGALVAGAMLAASATAGAEPPPPGLPADPVVPAPQGPTGMIPPLSTLTSPLAQSGATPETRTGGLPTQPFADGPANEFFLAQNPVPEAPGEAPGGAPPNLTAFNNAYLLPQNLVPAAPGEGQLYDVAPGEEMANIGPLDVLSRVHQMHVDGYLKGGLLGQAPQEQHGEPAPPAPDPALPLPPPPPPGE
jgi:hypothetical protein